MCQAPLTKNQRGFLPLIRGLLWKFWGWSEFGASPVYLSAPIGPPDLHQQRGRRRRGLPCGLDGGALEELLGYLEGPGEQPVQQFRPVSLGGEGALTPVYRHQAVGAVDCLLPEGFVKDLKDCSGIDPSLFPDWALGTFVVLPACEGVVVNLSENVGNGAP